MKSALIALLPLTALLAACGGASGTLPEAAAQRAATCGVITANQARATIADIKAPLSAAQQGAVLRPALLYGSEGEEFSRDRVAEVVGAMPALGESFSEEDIRKLAPQCAQAYPAPPTPVKLPDDPLTAAMGCDQLSDFMRQALSGVNASSYKENFDAYFALNQALDKRLAPLLSQRGIRGVEASEAQGRKAMAAIVKLGEPTAVLDECSARYVKG